MAVSEQMVAPLLRTRCRLAPSSCQQKFTGNNRTRIWRADARRKNALMPVLTLPSVVFRLAPGILKLATCFCRRLAHDFVAQGYSLPSNV